MTEHDIINRDTQTLSDFDLETKMLDSTTGDSKPGSSSSSVSSYGSVTKGTKISKKAPKFSHFNYEVNDIIASGGMGCVFNVKDKSLDRDVAVKLIFNDKKETRFLEEARITSQLEHPNIIPIHEINKDDTGNTYFSMKLVKGSTLAQIIERLNKGDEETKERWSLFALLDVFTSICNAMDFAHSHDVIHRDLKPDNIMIGRFGEVLVMDWGLAKKIGATDRDITNDEFLEEVSYSEHDRMNTIEGAVMGTPYYMSPEQAEGNISEIDKKSDIYSLGAILYELLSYKVIFKGKTVQSILEAVKKGDIVSPELRNPNVVIPKELVAISMKALSFDKEDRYDSVADIRNDIWSFKNGLTVSAKEYSSFEKTVKFVKRNWRVSLVLSFLIIASFVFFQVVNSASEKIEEAELAIKGINEDKELLEQQIENNNKRKWYSIYDIDFDYTMVAVDNKDIGEENLEEEDLVDEEADEKNRVKAIKKKKKDLLAKLKRDWLYEGNLWEYSENVPLRKNSKSYSLRDDGYAIGPFTKDKSKIVVEDDAFPSVIQMSSSTSTRYNKKLNDEILSGELRAVYQFTCWGNEFGGLHLSLFGNNWSKGYIFQIAGYNNSKVAINKENKDKFQNPIDLFFQDFSLETGKKYMVEASVVKQDKQEEGEIVTVALISLIIKEEVGDVWKTILKKEIVDDKPLDISLSNLDASKRKVCLWSVDKSLLVLHSFELFKYGKPIKADLLKTAFDYYERKQYTASILLFKDIIDSNQEDWRIEKAKEGYGAYVYASRLNSHRYEYIRSVQVVSKNKKYKYKGKNDFFSYSYDKKKKKHIYLNNKGSKFNFSIINHELLLNVKNDNISSLSFLKYKYSIGRGKTENRIMEDIRRLTVSSRRISKIDEIKSIKKLRLLNILNCPKIKNLSAILESNITTLIFNPKNFKLEELKKLEKHSTITEIGISESEKKPSKLFWKDFWKEK